MSDIDLYNRRAEREKKARLAAEKLLEDKSLELYQSNKELQKLAETVAKREARISSIVELAGEAIIVTDKHERITGINSAVLKIFGYDNKQQVEDSTINLLIPKCREGVCINFNIVNEAIGKRKNGENFPVEFSISRVPDGDSWDMTWIVRDVSKRKAAEKNLAELHERLLDTSRQAGMAEIAVSVLHNVGNVLNSINTSTDMMARELKNSKVAGLVKAMGLIERNSDDVGNYLSNTDEGKQLINYIQCLTPNLEQENEQLLTECSNLQDGIEHIKNVISAQQSYATGSGILQDFSIVRLLEDAIAMNKVLLHSYGIQLNWEVATAPDQVTADKHRIMQIMGNLVRNAVQSIGEAEPLEPKLLLSVNIQENQTLEINLVDNGMGISKEALTKIFSYGFTTKADGHGFGLHSSVLAAKEMGGELQAHSEGSGQGATFTLLVPLQAKDLAAENNQDTQLNSC